MGSNFDPNARSRFGDAPQREGSRNETLTLALHAKTDRAVRLSEIGDDAQASWIPRSLIKEIKLCGKTTRGFARDGQMVDLEMVEVTMASWRAKQEGWL